MRAAVASAVALAGALGALYAFTMPPLQVADEKTHLFRALGVARGSCKATELTRVPNSVLRFSATFPPVVEKRRLLADASVARWANVALDVERAGEVSATAADVYSCVPYLAPAAALRVAIELGWSPLWLLYAGRLANLALYVVALALALAILPAFRVVLLALALTPMALHQAASLSADGATIASAFLATAIATAVATRERDRPSGRARWALSGALAVAALCKSNVALVPLAACLPRRANETRRRHVVAVALVAAPAVALAVGWSWWSHDSLQRFGAAQASRGADMAANSWAVLAHPATFVGSIAHTAQNEGATLVRQMIGGLGWATVALPAWTTWLYAAVLLAASWLGTRATSLHAGTRAALLGAALLGCLSAFWGAWTISPTVAGLPPGGGVVGGLAGRYFIPFALPALIALSVPGARRTVRSLAVAVPCAALLVNAVALGEIRRHYYTSDGWLPDTAVFDLVAPRVVVLAPGDRLEQGLRPRAARLARIDVDVATAGRRLPGGTVRAQLVAPDGATLADVRRSLTGVRDGDHLSFSFAPLAASRGAALRLVVTLEDLPAGSVFGLHTTGHRHDRHPAGTLSMNGVATGGDLQLRAYRAARGFDPTADR